MARKRRLLYESLETRRVLAAIEVTTVDDVIDANDGFVSLREAIIATNGSGDDNEITFAPAINGKPIVLANEQLVISDTLTVQGNPAINTIIDANEQSRVFFINTTGDVALADLTITGGLTTGSSNAGGGIFSQATTSTLTITGSQIIGNRTTSLESGGGGISVNGNLVMIGSTVANNSTSGADSPGGGIASPLSGNIRLENSTISGNTVLGTTAIGGGGLYFDDGDVTIQNSTITGNSAPIGGGIGIFADNFGESLSIGNSIIANNSAVTNRDFTAPGAPANNLIVSYSLIGDNSGTTLTASATADANGNLVGTPAALIDPMLGPLQLNGGLSPTHALLSGSPAFDSGSSSFAGPPDQDQRGLPFVRVASSRLDIGAYEAQTVDSSLFIVTTIDDEFDYSNTDVSLREAINNANGSLGANTITFADGVSGTITLTQGELQISDSLTIQGPGQSLLAIDANQQSRVINILGGTASDVTLSGLTITGGQTTGDNTTPSDSTFSGGGILFGSTGTLALAATTISNNNAEGLNTFGGGIFSPVGSVMVAGSTLSGNKTFGEEESAGGGGLATLSGSVRLINSTVSGNSTAGSSARGGGIYSYDGEISLTGSTVSENSIDNTPSGAVGGGVFSRRGPILLTGSTVSGNRITSPAARAGGIGAYAGDITLTNSTLSGNRVIDPDAEGGGLHTRGNRVTIVNSTITGNVAGRASGGLFLTALNPLLGEKLTIHNSIIAGNTAGINPDFTAPSLPETNLEIRNSLIGDNTGTSLAATTTVNGNLVGTSSAPINPTLGPLSFNGGTTQTHALLSGSNAINAGSNALAVNAGTALTNDQRGVPFVRIANSTVDIGAFELQTFTASSFIVTTTNDELDFSNTDVSLREAIITANGSDGPDTITFANDIFGRITLTEGELPITDSLTIAGPGQSVLSIDASQQSRVFNVSGGGPAINLTLSGLTITGGRTMGNNNFGDNGFSGGGIRFDSSGKLTLTNSTVSGNGTLGTFAFGGGIYSTTGSVNLINSTVANNSTAGFIASGGGVFSNAGAVTMTGSTIAGNTTTGANSSGGGVFTFLSNLSLTNSTVSGNQVTGSDSDGGGLHFDDSIVTITNSTITNNDASRSGGGLMTVANSSDKKLTIHNSIIADNIAATNADFTAPTSTEANLEVRSSLIGDNAGTSLTATTSVNGNLIGTTAAPINPLLGPLALNGGTTQTHAPLNGSPAIDGGDNALAVDESSTALPFDQRGFLFIRIANITVDIGAFEFQPPLIPFFFNVTTTEDELNDDSRISLREAINFANGNPGRDTITFFSGLSSELAFLVNVTGVINLSLGELQVTESLTINGPGQSLIAIDANQRSRVFNVFGDSIVDLTISGLTITGGQTTGNNETLGADNDFSGGGIRFVSSGALTLTGSTVSGNRTTGTNATGGGIYSSAGLVTLLRSSVIDNSTSGAGAHGGGVFGFAGSVTITDSTIARNTTDGDGASGGGVFTVTADLALTNSTVSGNQLTGVGSDGGGLFANASLVRIVNSTITGNTATRAGGGLGTIANSYNQKRTIHNSLIAGNSAATDPDFTAPFSPVTNLEVRSSLIGDNTGTSLTASATADANGNLIGTPAALIDPLLGPLALRGGATLTHALLAGSPAINAGSNALAINNATPLVTDQRSAPFNRIADTTVDIGAFELQAPFSSPLFVNTTNDELDYSNTNLSLREAINNANANPGEDAILFDPAVFDTAQTINLNLGELAIGESMSITAPAGTTLVIDANQRSRVLNVVGGSLIDVALFGLTITGGQTTGSNRNGDDAFSGGGIRFASAGSLNLIDTVVSGNRTTGEFASGGGIFVNGAELRLRNSSITRNAVEGGNSGGGGVHTGGGRVSITNSSVTKNVVSGSYGFGGGIVSFTDATTLTGSTVAENSTTGSRSNGGGIVALNSELTLTNSTVSGNSTPGSGGGVFALYAPVTLTNSTVTGNRSLNGPGSGGGVYFLNTPVNPALTIRNSIVAGNTVAAGSTAPDLLPDPNAALTVEFSLIGDNTGTALPPAPTPNNLGNVVGTATAKIDPRLAPLANNGGTTATHALLSGSPAINGGLNALAVNNGAPLGNDQRGVPFSRIADATVDIGAFESQPLDPAAFIVTTTDDELDYSNTAVSLREAINSANGDPDTSTITFATGVTGTITLTLGELPITQSVTITGPGANSLVIDANQQSRVLNVQAGTALDVALTGLSITGGRTVGDSIDLFSGEFGGGGIRFDSAGTLTLTGVTLSENSTTGIGASGGGIFANGGVVTLNSSTISANITSGFFAAGGGIAIFDGALALTNSTVSGNTTSGTSASGAGILSLASSVALFNSTVTNNRTTGNGANGGGIAVVTSQVGTPTSLSIRNSIVAGNAVAGAGGGPDFVPDPATVLTVQFSLIGDNTDTTLAASATSDANGNLIGSSAAKIDPLIGPLQDNGGPTQTHALLPGSPAINAGSNALAVDSGSSTLTTDQRGAGFPRITNGTVDIGSFETAAIPLDFGDAPAPYPVTIAVDGARHVIGDLFLGEGVDAEIDGANSAAADGDVNDDGVFVIATFISTIVAVTSSFSIIASAAGKLDAWIDFNKDGDWNDAGEQIFDSVDLIEGDNLLSFTIPAAAITGSTGARFRLSTAGQLSPTGAADDGEVEDYLAQIVAGSASTVVDIDTPAGDNQAIVENGRLVVRNGSLTLFEAPLTSFGELNLNGSSLDDTFKLAIGEVLSSQSVVIDAALGNDRLELLGTQQTLDLTAEGTTIREVEEIDITGNGDNRLVISVEAIKAISPSVDKLAIVSDSESKITFGDGWSVDTPRFINGVFTHVISERAAGGTARIELRNDRLLTNPVNVFDADRNGTIQPLDALRVINALSRLGIGPITLPTNDGEINRTYFDVSGNNILTALDALRVINALSRINRGGQAEGEAADGEAIALLSDPAITIRKSEPAVAPPTAEPVSLPTPAVAAAWDSSITDSRSINAIDLALIDYGAPADEAEPEFEFDCIAADTISARLR